MRSILDRARAAAVSVLIPTLINININQRIKAVEKEISKSETDRRLAETIKAIQTKWGRRALHKLTHRPQHTAISTTFENLDELTGLGGIPLGRITEFTGRPTSGLSTVALKTMALAQHQFPIVYIDGDQNFDPDYAVRCGLRLDELILIRPHSWSQTLAILHDLILTAPPGLLILDIPSSISRSKQEISKLKHTLDRLIQTLSKTHCALLILHALTAPLPLNIAEPMQYTTLHLRFQREEWLYQRHDIRGYQVSVFVDKNKLGPAGHATTLQITFDHTVQGDAA